MSSLPRLVEDPVLNDPFEEPTRHHALDGGVPRVVASRRPPGYFARRRGATQDGLMAESFVEFELVKELRRRVAEWRKDGYPGATDVTRQLFSAWFHPDRAKRLFYCQREAIETLVFLVEGPRDLLKGVEVPREQRVDVDWELALVRAVGGTAGVAQVNTRTLKRLAEALDLPASNAPREELVEKVRRRLDKIESALAEKYGAAWRTVPASRTRPGLVRYCARMATATGKTVVMAALVVWTVLNHAAAPLDPRFCGAVVVVCPNLTVKERLRVLKPTVGRNYYEEFDLVPPAWTDALASGVVVITNWQAFGNLPGGLRHRVVRKGPTRPAVRIRRLLDWLGGRGNVLVLNDEAHHAYRLEAELAEKLPLSSPGGHWSAATVWMQALDALDDARGVRLCVDFSATPFFPQASGRPEGTPFPWIVSDFNLLDAIESGLVKVPRVAVDQNGAVVPEFYFTWKALEGAREHPEEAADQLEEQLTHVAKLWRQSFEDFQSRGSRVPPVLVVVCDNVKLAKKLHERLASGGVAPEFKNDPPPARPVTVRIDSDVLAAATERPNKLAGDDPAEKLRRLVDTVGKPGEPGGQVRCLVSVGMLSEGWDARNVTVVLGVRAFGSSLLCEQVVGRGLRRTQYDDLTYLEYVDVVGVPFSVFPVKGRRPGELAAPTPATLVRPVEGRESLAISFPRVTGYLPASRWALEVDWDSLDHAALARLFSQVATKRRGRFAYLVARELAAELERREIPVQCLKGTASGALLFREALKVVHEISNRVKRVPQRTACDQEDAAAVALMLVRAVSRSVKLKTEPSGGGWLPRLDPFRPVGSTFEVVARTTSPCVRTTRSHLGACPVRTPWDREVLKNLEGDETVVAYAKCGGGPGELDLVVPSLRGGPGLRPKFIVRYRPPDVSEPYDGLNVLLFDENSQDEGEDLDRWVDAVNLAGRWGAWSWFVTPRELASFNRPTSFSAPR